MKNFLNNDVCVIGGGPAGQAAALTLARSLRKVLLIDSSQPRNQNCKNIQNFLPAEGIEPAEFATIANETLEKYGVKILREEVLNISDRLEITLKSGATLSSPKVLLATGVVDLLEDVPELKKHWGTRIVHCPYCYGYENQNKRVGVLAPNNETGEQFKKLVSIWFKDLQVFSKLEELPEILRKVDTLFYRPGFTAMRPFLSDLGLKLTEFNTFEVTENHRTNIQGIYAAGDCADPKRQQYSVALASGTSAGYLINLDLGPATFQA